MAVLIDKSTRLLVQGLTGREGTFHAKQAAAYGTTVVGGVTPGKGGTMHEGWPIFDTVARSRREDGRQCVGHLRAAAVCRRRRDGSRRRGHRCGGLHHRRHPDARHDAGDDVPEVPSRHAAGRAQLPGRHLGRQGQGRHHPRAHLQGRPDRHRVQERHADLRGHSPADTARTRADDLHRHRRRSADRHDAHRCAEAVCGRP